MLTSKAIYANGKVAFHIYLVTGEHNSLVSTLPDELLKRHFQRELFHLLNALVINQKMAERMLDEFAGVILRDGRFKVYYYPDYLTNEGINFATAERLIHLQDTFALKPGMCYSQGLNPVEFFHLQQQFNLSKRYILKSCKYLSLEEFTTKYLINTTAQFCFREYTQVVEYMLEFDDELVECAGVIDANKDLKMLVTI